MAPRQAKRNAAKIPRQPLEQGKRPQGIKKERPQPSSRKSARLEGIQRRQEQTVSKDENTQQKQPFPLPTPDRKRKRKRLQEFEDPTIRSPGKSLQKRRRTSWAGAAVEDTCGQEETSSVPENKINPIEYWIRKTSWPKEYFTQDDQTRKDLEKDSWIEEFKDEDWFREQFGDISRMSYLLAKQKSSSSLRRKDSESDTTTPSDQKPREAKSTPYARPSYATVLATKGSFMDKSDLGITDASKSLCRILLEKEQTVPQDSLFRDDLFDKTCRKIQDRNEARVIQDITRLIVPSAETLATYGATHLNHLIESVNEGWKSAISFYGPRPQPDYSLGFGRSAFTDSQLEKLKPFVGEVTDSFTSYFMATWQIYFPFLIEFDRAV